MKIKKNDMVKVLAGKDSGKTGKVLKIYPREHKAIVEGVNYIKKHLRKSQDNPQGGIAQREALINMSNLAVICSRCNKATRVGFTKLSDGSKARYCKSCKETI
jgi:large subunit ribosomal protein L24